MKKAFGNDEEINELGTINFRRLFCIHLVCWACSAMSLICLEWKYQLKAIPALTQYGKPWAELRASSSLVCLTCHVIEYHIASDNYKFQTKCQRELLKNSKKLIYWPDYGIKFNYIRSKSHCVNHSFFWNCLLVYYLYEFLWNVSKTLTEKNLIFLAWKIRRQN